MILFDEALGIKLDSINEATELGKKLGVIEEPLHVVIAIDSSGSMNGSDTAKSAALTIINSIYNRKNDKDMLGYVSWKHYPAEYSKNISHDYMNDYGDISNKILSIKFDGNTCFKAGLNESLNLLKNNTSNSALEILILISDGIDNCNRSMGNLTCDQVKNIDLSKTYIYTIQIGDKEEKAELLKCLTRELPQLWTLPMNPSRIAVGNTIKLQEDEGPEFSLNARGKVIKYQEQNTNVIVTKIVENGNKGPRIKIRLEAPDANVSDSLVMAIDSSGSFGEGGNPDYGKNLRHAIVPSLEEISATLPNSTVSILSWDEDIDFAYSDLANRDPKRARLVPIKQAIQEIGDNSVFVAKPFYKSFFGFELPILAVDKPYPNSPYYTSEFEPTIFDTGLEGSLDVFSSQFPKKNADEKDTILKSILFITGRSEFTKFSPSLIERARSQNCTIYPIGIGVIEGTEMEKNLKLAAAATEGKYYYSSGGSDWTKDNVIDVISEVAKDIRNNPLLDDITLVETVYPYLKIDTSTIKVTKDSLKLGYSLIPQPPNQDGTTTIVIQLNSNENLTRNSVIEISMDAELDLSLPVEVNQSRRNVCWNIDQDTRISSISYRWIKPEQRFEVLLPENSINF